MYYFIMFPHNYLSIVLKIAAGTLLFSLIINVLVIAYLTRPSPGGSAGLIFLLFFSNL